MLLMNARKGIVGSFLCWSPERRLPAAMPNCVSSSSSFLFPPSSSSILVSRKSGREMEGGGGNEGRHAIERAIYLPLPPVFPGKICGRSTEGVIVAKFTGWLRAGVTNPFPVRHFLRRKTNADIYVVGGKSCALSLREIGKDRLTPARRQKERKGF